MALEKPPSIAMHPFKSAKWDEITSGHDFTESDSPTLALLCQWHSVAQQAMDDLDSISGQIVYENKMGDLREMPQIGTMERASREIRQLNKQLGIIDGADTKKAGGVGATNVLTLLNGKRADRRANATGENRAVGM